MRFSARNDTYAPVEVELRLERLGNVQGGASRLVRRVVPARSTVALTLLSARQPGKPVSYKSKFDFALGNPGQRQQAFRYPLPWRGGPFRLTQGPNGRYSHFGPKGRYAMDIAMPEGTPIIAARAGMVIKTENSQSGRGSHPSGNFVRILHEDGTMGVYLHLMRAQWWSGKGSGWCTARRWQNPAIPATAAARTCTLWCSATSGWRWSRYPTSSTSPSAGCRTLPPATPEAAQSSLSTLARTIFGPFIFLMMMRRPSTSRSSSSSGTRLRVS